MNLKRKKIQELERWKKTKKRLPLVLKGARQVGKTHLIRHWSHQFKNYHEFNFQKDHDLSELFQSTNNPQKLIKKLEIYSEKKINLKEDLIFFDEIQDCPEALNSLKFFAEEFPESYIVSAGSLLGIYLSNKSFPVGKVTFVELFPMDFAEFLMALDKVQLAKLLQNNLNETKNFHAQYCELLQDYYIVGGMPAAIIEYLESKDFSRVRRVHENLLQSYRGDFAKYAGTVNALHILQIFESIPKQLAKDNRKFFFNILKNGARYSEYSNAIQWLISAGLAYKIPILNHAEIPLKTLIEENIFKLYFIDVGLLSTHADLPTSAFLSKENLFATFKGAFAENFVAQEFLSQRNEKLYCWQGKTSEVDFLFQQDMTIIPVEVKSGVSGKLKSLQFFCEKYKINWKLRCSLHPYDVNETSKFTNYPLYLAQYFGI